MQQQQFHMKQSNYMTAILAWLDTMPTETNADDSAIHTIVQFQIIPINYGETFQAVVLCNHHELPSPHDVNGA